MKIDLAVFLLVVGFVLFCRAITITTPVLDLEFPEDSPSCYLLSPSKSFWLDLTLKQIAEYTEDNDEVYTEPVPTHFIINLTTWHQFSDTYLITVEQLDYTGSFLNNATFHATFWVITTNGTSSTVPQYIHVLPRMSPDTLVYPGYTSLQTFFELSNWPFKMTTNKLGISLNLKCNASPLDVTSSNYPTFSLVTLPYATYGTSLFTYIYSNAICDNTSQPVAVKHHVDGLSPLNVDLVFSLPYFSHQGYYTPLMNIVPVVYSKPWLGIILACVIGIFLCTCFACLIYWVQRYYKKIAPPQQFELTPLGEDTKINDTEQR
eukprot:TRINITY_DN1311_c0_g2_i2.p1 TRINITY_DN1311_c0_g2~~TRINITY_DN1311_c0_g2_i2.p1  ORF type:complete len:319 (-),score=28.22 TRINITY_DN1311_c0_g2_i2:122-1078(-)